MRNKAIAPGLNFTVNQNTEGTVEHCLKSFIEQSKEADQDRRIITQVGAEGKKMKIEKDLKELIHKAATQMEIDHYIVSRVQINLNNDLQQILNEENNSNFNKNLLIRDIKSSLKTKYRQILENELETSRPKMVWKEKVSSLDSQIELSELIKEDFQGSIEISGGNDSAKTTLTK